MNTLRVLVLLAGVVAGFTAWIFRYEPMGVSLVWDRWEHRKCTVDWDNNIRCAHND